MNEQQFNSLPLEQRIVAQKKLIDAGLYNGAADGKWGGGTKAAFELEAQRAGDEAKASEAASAAKRADDLRGQELDIQRLQAQGARGATDAATAEATRQTEARRMRDEQAGSPLGLAAQTGATVGAPLAGVGAGRGAGLLINALMNQSQTERNKTLAGVAQDRVAGLTTREGARTAAQLSGAMPSANSAVRVAGRMAPHLGLGGLAIGKGGLMLEQADPNGPFYPEMANRAAGLGMIGAGSGVLERGITHAVAPGVPPDARSIAIIESNQLRRNGSQGGPVRAPVGDIIDVASESVKAPAALEAPEATPATPGTKAYMAAQAKELGLKGTSKLSKGELATKLAEAMSEHGGKRTVPKRLPKLPGGAGAAALAGSLAYALTPDRADAATGAPTNGRAEGLTNAAIAGGGAYGVSKLAQMLKPVVGTALGVGGQMLAPMMAADAYDPTPDQLATDRNTAARYLPAPLRFGAIEDAYQASLLPERGDRSDDAMLARGSADQAEAMPMPSASALQIPQNIPAPNADGSSPYPPAIMGRLQRMQSTGASPEQIASWLNQAVR